MTTYPTKWELFEILSNTFGLFAVFALFFFIFYIDAIALITLLTSLGIYFFTLIIRLSVLSKR